MDTKTTSLDKLYLYGALTFAAAPALALILAILDIVL